MCLCIIIVYYHYYQYYHNECYYMMINSALRLYAARYGNPPSSFENQRDSNSEFRGCEHVSGVIRRVSGTMPSKQPRIAGRTTTSNTYV